MNGKPKYPVTGDRYGSLRDPHQVCKVLRVLEGQVTFRWLGRYAYIDPQTVPVNRFVIDFRYLGKCDI